MKLQKLFSITLSTTLLVALSALAASRVAFAQATPESTIDWGAELRMLGISPDQPEMKAVQVDAQTCVSNRGLSFAMAGIAGDHLMGPVTLSHNSTVLAESKASSIVDVKADDGTFSFTAQNNKSETVLSVEGAKDKSGHYTLIVRRPALGMIGFRCQ